MLLQWIHYSQPLQASLQDSESGWYSQTNHQITSIPGLRRSSGVFQYRISGGLICYRKPWILPANRRVSRGFSLKAVLEISWMMIKLNPGHSPWIDGHIPLFWWLPWFWLWKIAQFEVKSPWKLWFYIAMWNRQRINGGFLKWWFIDGIVHL